MINNDDLKIFLEWRDNLFLNGCTDPLVMPVSESVEPLLKAVNKSLSESKKFYLDYDKAVDLYRLEYILSNKFICLDELDGSELHRLITKEYDSNKAVFLNGALAIFEGSKVNKIILDYILKCFKDFKYIEYVLFYCVLSISKNTSDLYARADSFLKLVERSRKNVDGVQFKDDALVSAMAKFIKGVYSEEVWNNLKGDSDMEKAIRLVNSEAHLRKLSFQELLTMNSKTVLVKCFGNPAPIAINSLTPLCIHVNTSNKLDEIDFCEEDGNRLFIITEAYSKSSLNNNSHINVYALD